MKKQKKLGFTLVEIMLGILIVSIVIIGGFQAFSSVMIGKSRLIQETDIQKESFYFTQRLFEMIKMGGTIDFEEYFNRKVIGNTTFSSGHFLEQSGFGNFANGGNVGTSNYGSGFYYCRSSDTENMGTGGCYNNNHNTYGTSLSTIQQRYGQYSFQFIDYNSNMNNESSYCLPGIYGGLGDENCSGYIIGDDDDEYIGEGPIVFTGGTDVTELYLISGDKKTRTYFRWFVDRDPEAPSGYSCFIDSTNSITGSGCLGTVQYLILKGEDMGMEHTSNSTDITFSDGVIDTWLIDDNFIGGGNVAGTGSVNRINLFPDSINVSEFKIYLYPNKDIGRAWKNNEESVNINPYVQIKTKLKPSWKSRKKIRGEGKELDFSMTVNLSDMYTK